MSRNKYSIDLQKHMAVCDANYIRLLKLLPQLEVYRSKILKISPKKCEDFDTTHSYFKLNKVWCYMFQRCVYTG